MKKLICNANIVNEGQIFKGSVLIGHDRIEHIYRDGDEIVLKNPVEKIEAEGMWLLPGVIDDQVHFREPGMTAKGDIFTESRAAVAGGVTSYMEMPNTKPQTTTLELLEEKYALAATRSMANYSFYLGATNQNIRELVKVNPARVPGLKLFLGSSTGNMLVDKKDSLERIFGEAGMLIAIHAEKEEVIRRNIQYYTNLHGEDLDISSIARSVARRPATNARPRRLNWLPAWIPVCISCISPRRRNYRCSVTIFP